MKSSVMARTKAKKKRPRNNSIYLVDEEDDDGDEEEKREIVRTNEDDPHICSPPPPPTLEMIEEAMQPYPHQHQQQQPFAAAFEVEEEEPLPQQPKEEGEGDNCSPRQKSLTVIAIQMIVVLSIIALVFGISFGVLHNDDKNKTNQQPKEDQVDETLLPLNSTTADDHNKNNDSSNSSSSSIAGAAANDCPAPWIINEYIYYLSLVGSIEDTSTMSEVLVEAFREAYYSSQPQQQQSSQAQDQAANDTTVDPCAPSLLNVSQISLIDNTTSISRQAQPQPSTRRRWFQQLNLEEEGVEAGVDVDGVEAQEEEEVAADPNNTNSSTVRPTEPIITSAPTIEPSSMAPSPSIPTSQTTTVIGIQVTAQQAATTATANANNSNAKEDQLLLLDLFTEEKETRFVHTLNEQLAASKVAVEVERIRPGQTNSETTFTITGSASVSNVYNRTRAPSSTTTNSGASADDPDEENDTQSMDTSPSFFNCTLNSTCAWIISILDPVHPSSTRAKLDMGGTCQNWALQWLSSAPHSNNKGACTTTACAEEDDVFGRTQEDYRIRQQYALAVLYCELVMNDGEDGDKELLGWLSHQEHECEWAMAGLGTHPPCSSNGYYETIHFYNATTTVLQGTLAPELSMISTLRHINISHAQGLSSSTIPSEWTQLSMLETLVLSSNGLVGTIPWESIASTWKLMKHLDLSHNSLQGTALSNKFNIDMPHLKVLCLGDNQLTGTIPQEPFIFLEELKQLHLYNNFLTGTIPLEINMALTMEELLLHSNQLTGTIPSIMTFKNNNLRWLTLYDNPLLQGDLNTGFCSEQGTGTEHGLGIIVQVDTDLVLCDCCTPPPTNSTAQPPFVDQHPQLDGHGQDGSISSSTEDDNTRNWYFCVDAWPDGSYILDVVTGEMVMYVSNFEIDYNPVGLAQIHGKLYVYINSPVPGVRELNPTTGSLTGFHAVGQEDSSPHDVNSDDKYEWTGMAMVARNNILLVTIHDKAHLFAVDPETGDERVVCNDILRDSPVHNVSLAAMALAPSGEIYGLQWNIVAHPDLFLIDPDGCTIRNVAKANVAVGLVGSLVWVPQTKMLLGSSSSLGLFDMALDGTVSNVRKTFASVVPQGMIPINEIDGLAATIELGGAEDTSTWIYCVDASEHGLYILDTVTGYLVEYVVDLKYSTTPIAVVLVHDKIYVYNNSPTPGLLQIDPQTAAVTAMAFSQRKIDSLAVQDNVLFASFQGSSSLFTLDPETGEEDVVCTGVLPTRLAGMDFHPTSGLLYGAELSTTSAARIYTIDLGTCTSTLAATMTADVGVVGCIVWNARTGMFLGSSIKSRLYDLDLDGTVSNFRSLGSRFSPQGMAFYSTNDDNDSIPSFTDIFEDPWIGLRPDQVVKWENDGSGLELEVVNALEGAHWESIFGQVVTDWDSGSPDALMLSPTKTEADPFCEPIANKFKVCNGDYGHSMWKGINQVLIQNGYIVASTAKMNEYYLADASSEVQRYSMCHEMGHGFGLPHTDEDFFNEDLGNCMDYTNTPAVTNFSPDVSNFEFLKELYGIVLPATTRHRKLKDRALQNKGGGIPPEVLSQLRQVLPQLENSSRIQSGGGDAVQEKLVWAPLHPSKYEEIDSVDLGNGWSVRVHKMLHIAFDEDESQ
jgi:hypothetical protein